MLLLLLLLLLLLRTAPACARSIKKQCRAKPHDRRSCRK
jgi:hypothetical protein